MARGASIAVVLNSRAGSIQDRPHVATELRDAFLAAGYDAEILAPDRATDVVAAARHAAARASIVVAAGGDGTVSAVTAAIADSPAALGVLPFGTRNHFARDLGVPLDLRGAVATITAGHTARVDVGRVNDRLFVNNVSIGVYPGFVRMREQLRRQGYRRWRATTVSAWRMISHYRDLSVDIDANGEIRRRQTPFVVVGNNAYVINGLDLGGRSRLDEGKLFVYVTQGTRFEIVDVTEASVSTRATTVQVAIDGEIAVLSEPLRFQTCPGALRVLVQRV